MREAFVNIIIKFLLWVLCKIDYGTLSQIPKDGPLILFGNHINFLDAPLVFSYLWPRKFVSLVKKETFDSPFLRFLFNTWHGIPVNRGTADFTALKTALKALEDKKILVLAPEGTRTNDGKLIKGNPGILAIAQKSNAPIIPVGLYGTEKFHENFRKLKRTKVFFRVGTPFSLALDSKFPDQQTRSLATDEVMFQLAKLLPEQNRGYYSDVENATTHYLRFLEDIPCNKQ